MNEPDDNESGIGFVAVHVGAGYHSPANAELYKTICRQACLQAVELLREKKSALEAVKTAVVVLEDSPWTNAGVGSNLTVQGTVECDASIMDGQSLQYGAVGAIEGVNNPVTVAENLLRTQMLGNMSLGRIPPSTLVGPGAHEWAKNRGLINQRGGDLLITDTSHKAFLKHKRKLDIIEERLNSPKRHKHLKKIEMNETSFVTSPSNGSNRVSLSPSSSSSSSSSSVSNDSTSSMAFSSQECNHNTAESQATNSDISPIVNGNGHAPASSSSSPPPPSSSSSNHAVPQLNGMDGTLDNREVDANDNDSVVSSATDIEPGSEDRLYDTVGAVAVDHNGRVVSAVSSGGIVLKQPGRLGQAALYGCGCWAENDSKRQQGVAISTSGCGEHLTKALLARECAIYLHSGEDPTSALYNVFQNKFLGSPFLKGVSQKLGGALALCADYSRQDEMQVEVLWAHTTDSMCLAFMSTGDMQPKALVSRLPDSSKCGQSCSVQSKSYTLVKSSTPENS